MTGESLVQDAPKQRVALQVVTRAELAAGVYQERWDDPEGVAVMLGEKRSALLCKPARWRRQRTGANHRHA